MSKRFAVLLCTTVMPAFSAPALAQTTSGTTASDRDRDDSLPDVIVTARRRTEDAQRVPAALSVVGDRA